MGVSYTFVLEHDGDDSERNDYIGELPDVERALFNRWDGMYRNDMDKWGGKGHPPQVEKHFGEAFYFVGNRWWLNNIPVQIEKLRSEIETTEGIDEYDERTLKSAAYGLQEVYDNAMKMCKSHKLEPEKCCVMWWMTY